MKRRLSFALLLLLIPTLVLAQTDCGNGLPCGPIPWVLPVIPRLSSPTPIPTMQATSSSPTHTPAPGSPTNTPVPLVNTGPLDAQVATLGAVMQSTPVRVSDINGSYAESTDTPTDLGSSAGTFFGYVRGLAELDLGVLNPFLFFLLVDFVLTLTIWAATLLIPIIATLIGLIRRGVSFIMEFLPL